MALVTVSQWLADAERLFAPVSPVPRRDAEILAAHFLGCEPSDLALSIAAALPDPQRWQAAMKRRQAGEPVAYITGIQAFWEDEFHVSPATLIPRPDTESLVEAALGAMPPGADILDLGTGSGCILLSLLRSAKGTRGVGVDISSATLAVAGANARRLGLSARAAFTLGSWYQPVAGRRFDIIIANPPYVRTLDLSGLMPDVRDFEPQSALDGGPTGLGPYSEIIQSAPAYLRAGGALLVECGFDQAGAIARLFEDAGLQGVEIGHDLAGLPRLVSGRLPGRSIP